jgi:murein DD-endopeptidase MepM/ murein hydrolase activator NlpD
MRRPGPDRPGWSPRRRRRGSLRRAGLLLVTTALLGGLFASSPAGPVAADELSDAIKAQQALQKEIAAQKARIKALEQDQADLRVELAGTKADLAAINVDLNAVRAQVVAMTVDVAVAEAAVQELDAQVARLDRRLADLEAEQARRTRELEASLDALAARIRLAYDADRTSLLETILSGASFTDVLVDVSYHLDLAEQDRALAERIAADRDVLAVISATVESARAEVEALRSEAAAAKADLDVRLAELDEAERALEALEAETKRLLAEQQAEYARLQKSEKDLEAQLAEAERAEEELADRIAELIRQQNQGSIPSEYNGSFVWPMSGRITQEFGCTGFSWEPRIGSCAHFHRGIDIAAPMYTPIRAAGPGKVIFVGRVPGPGVHAWVVIIAHSQRLVTWYAHIDDVTRPPVVRQGDWVASGQLIAYVGMTGRTTGPHLHWAVQLDGNWVNPRLFL